VGAYDGYFQAKANKIFYKKFQVYFGRNIVLSREKFTLKSVNDEK